MGVHAPSGQHPFKTTRPNQRPLTTGAVQTVLRRGVFAIDFAGWEVPDLSDADGAEKRVCVCECRGSY
eukprot:1005704-Rhodomonas_salina.1